METLFIFRTLVALCVGATALLHLLLLRSFLQLGFWKSSLATSLLALALVATGVNFFFARAQGLILPAGIAAFFAYQLFFFLGVATADRSLTAHLLCFLADVESGSMTEKDLREKFLADEFIAKRLHECRAAKLLQSESLSLRPRGLRVAKFYSLLSAAYRLKRRKAWKFSFGKNVERHPFDLSSKA